MTTPLPYEILGLFVLGVLWVNTLLIAFAAAKHLGELAALSRRFVPLGPDQEGIGLVSGRVVRGDGDGDALAAHLVEQVGRLTRDAEPTLLFADRRARGTSFGGAIEVGGQTLEVRKAEGPGVEVWLDRGALAAASRFSSAAAFDAALPDAKKARGAIREVRAPIAVGSVVHAVGALRRGEGGLRLEPDEGGSLLVSTFDPRSFCAKKAALVWLFIVVTLALCAGITALALREPIVSLSSKLGGVLGLAFFLLVQPAGTALRDAVLPPSRAPLGGIEKRPGRSD